MSDLSGQDKQREALQSRFSAIHNSAEVAAEKAKTIYAALLHESRHVRDGNFHAIAIADLAILFDLYDTHFFDGLLRRQLQQQGTPLLFKLSKKMTRAGGKTYLYRRPVAGVGAPLAMHFEIGISTTLLFQTFADVQRTVRVNGLVCKDRLEALQRIFEHELLHLAELLAWEESSCTAANFKTLAWKIFAHSDTTHDLVTPREQALTNFNVQVGDRVRFSHEGQRYEGVVNRITRRATILVEHPNGQPYTNGKRCLKFYVPVQLLEKDVSTEVNASHGQEPPSA